MSGWFSKPCPPPPTIFPEEWRHVPWDNKERDLTLVRDYRPHNEELQQLRILLYGPAGHGKSSFINSVDTVFQGRMTAQASADAISKDSFTNQYRDYKIKKGRPGRLYPFIFTDIMGIEKDTDRGAGVEDIKLAMMGHIKQGYKFNPRSKISEDHTHYNKSPTLNDRVHVLVCVLSASNVAIQSEEVMKKMRDVRLEARDLGIPQLAILTKIDELCPDVETNIRNTYKSMIIKEKMKELHLSLGIPLYCIHPVKNYHSEMDTHDDIDTLILSALKHMINFGEDFVNQS